MFGASLDNSSAQPESGTERRRRFVHVNVNVSVNVNVRSIRHSNTPTIKNNAAMRVIMPMKGMMNRSHAP